MLDVQMSGYTEMDQQREWLSLSIRLQSKISQMFATKGIQIKIGRSVLASLMLVFLVATLIWPQVTYDLVFEGIDLMWYKYSANRTERFLCIHMVGGIGNMLFQYAFAYSMARRSNFTLVCQPAQMHQLQKLFNVPNCSSHAMGNRVCFSQMYTVVTKINTGYAETVEKTKLKDDIHYSGYFQSWKYWGKYEDTLKRSLTIRQAVKEKAEDTINFEIQKLGYAHRSDVTLVGVHIRRGDMVEKYFHNYGYNVVPEEYVTKAKTYIRAKVKGPIVYVVSTNGMDWTKKMLSDSETVLLTGNTREVDFAVLSRCDHFIMSVGTFGWWVGWHVRGIVTYYTKPFRPGTELAKVYTEDYLTSFFYPGWIGIS